MPDNTPLAWDSNPQALARTLAETLASMDDGMRYTSVVHMALQDRIQHLRLNVPGIRPNESVYEDVFATHELFVPGCTCLDYARLENNPAGRHHRPVSMS